MSEFKEIMGILSVAIGLPAYTVYAWETIYGEVRPHPLSWLVFGVLTGTGFLIQQDHGGGAGSWVMGVTAPICLALSGLGFAKGEREFPKYEWAFLAAAGLVFCFYVWSKNSDFSTDFAFFVRPIVGGREADWFSYLLKQHSPEISAILATLVDVLGYGPTISKAWMRPHTDSFVSFLLNSIKFIPSLLAMDTISIATSIYPGTLVVVNFVVALLLAYRKVNFKPNKAH